MSLRTRFAPSPTGLLHLGNAYSALCCMQWAEQHQADCILRIEDIDHTRCREAYKQSLCEDLRWLGMTWPEPVLQQSQRLPIYRGVLKQLEDMQVIYPCFCTRRDIQDEIKRMTSAPHRDDPVTEYPGTCRRLTQSERQQRMQTQPFAWRVDIAKAMRRINRPLSWKDEAGLSHPLHLDHDVVIARRDIGVSYHLATVVDDADQGITHIIRGEDLRDSLAIHRLLQSLMNYPEPVYIHHRLVRDAQGQRLAKRSAGSTLASLRQLGIRAEQLQQFLLHSPDLVWPVSDGEPAAILALLGIDS